MTRRIVSCITTLAFAGTLFLLAGCEPQPGANTTPKPTPPTTPKSPDEKAPPAPPTPSTPKPEDPKKTSSATPAANTAVNAIAASATETIKDALKCGKEGCTQTGLPTKTVTNLGKTLRFCCDNCVADYKKANNIQ